MTDSRSKSYTITIPEDEIEEFDSLCTHAGMDPEYLIKYALGAYKFLTLAIAQGSTLYLDDAEIVLDVSDDDEEEAEEETEAEEDGVEMLVFRIIDGGKED